MRAILTVLAVCGLVAGAARADWVLVHKIEGDGHSDEMVLKIKGDKMRCDQGPHNSTIMDEKTGDVINLMHRVKRYEKMSAEALKAARESQKVLSKMILGAAADDATRPTPKLVPTGKTEKINGYDTEEYAAKIGDLTLHYWIAKNLPNWAALRPLILKREGSLPMAMGLNPADFPGMPVKTVMEFAGQKSPLAGQKSTMTLVSVKEEAVDDAVFEIPADYEQLHPKELPPPKTDVPREK